MNTKRVLEVIVTNVQEAQAAEAGGATRLELIKDFSTGGLTPDLSVVQRVVDAVAIPVRVMLRENASFGLASAQIRDRERELNAIIEKASALSNLHIDGIVIGYVCDGVVDTLTLEQILSHVPELKVTFHRAFESTKDKRSAIATLKRFPQIDCILTNGGQKSWADRIEQLLEWQKLAQPIKILVGGDVDEDALTLLAKTELHQVHLGRAARQPQAVDGAISVSKLTELHAIWDKLS